MLVAMTGTPGTGKTATCERLAEEGYQVVNLNELAFEANTVVGVDPERDVDIVDVDALCEKVSGLENDLIFLDGHFSHLMDVDISIVLRCNPNELKKRLEAKDWNERKVRENVEAEAVDAITIESLESVEETYEVDTTKRTIDQTVEAVLRIVQGQKEEYRIGQVDWSEVILDWY
ncbi:MAG: adenylate kinase family protein [Methanobacteriota archaeon]|nr:MAG: adenylate kinase family protein [Euryarchaeota archaeon]